MIIKKKRRFLDFNLDKEEIWLNELSLQGLELIHVGFRYHFKESNPKDTSLIKIDYQIFNKKEDFINYETLFYDSGWSLVSGGRHGGRQYFKRVDEHAGTEIFSDQSSKALRLKRLSDSLLYFAMIYLPIAVSLSMTTDFKFSSLFNPSSLYYTPGLWDLQGVDFWTAFLFETPFVILRIGAIIIIPILVISYLLLAYKANKMYQKESKE